MELPRSLYAKLLALVIFWGLPWSAQALDDDATSDINGVVIDPFTSQSVQVWRRGGYLQRPGDTGVCSATQIHPNWVLTAQHCQPSTHLYYGPGTEMSGASALSECHAAPNNVDMALCRLQNPEYYTSSAPYPVLSTMPPISSAPVPLDTNGTRVFYPGVSEKYGHFMAMGWGGESGKFIQFTAAEGVIKASIDERSTVPTWPLELGTRGVVTGVPGDSGGGLFWVHAPQAEPALVGLHRVGYVRITQAGPQFTSELLAWMASTITGAGDVAPVSTSWEQLYTPHGFIPDLPARPVVTLAANGQSATVSWQTPSAGDHQVPVASYTLSRGILVPPDGNGGRLDDTVEGIAVGTTSYLMQGLPAEKGQAICVTPRGSEGKYALNAQSMTGTKIDSTADFVRYRTDQIFQSNCISDIDTRFPAAPQVILSVKNTSASVRLITAKWTLPTSPDVVVNKYVVTRSIKYPSGPARSTTVEQTSTSHSISVNTGVTVCITVQSVSKHGLKTASALQCKVAS